MTDTQLKTATSEVLSLGWKDDNGERITMTEATDCKKVLTDIIPQLTKSDFFTKETTAVLTEFGWTRDGVKETEPVKAEFTPIPLEETTLSQDIENCEKLRDLKEIALSEPQFKKIRGRLSSFDVDSLKMEMITILNEPEDVPTKLHQKLEDMPIKVAVENFENEKIQVKDNTPVGDVYVPLSDEITGLDELANLPDELGVIPKDEIKDYYNHYHGQKGGIPVKDIIKKEPFISLFNINPTTLESITISMRNNGYDTAFPVILWGKVLIDGFTRTRAAEDAGLEWVPFEEKEFKDEHEALEYAMHNQRDRRNITEAELLRCISVIDTPMSKTEAGGRRGEKKVPTHKQTAKTLGIGESVVTDARTVLKDEKATEEVQEGKKTLREAAKEVREKKRKPKETISEALTKIGSVIQVLKDNAGKEMKLALLLKESESLGVSEDVMGIVMEVLTAVSLVKISEDVLIIKKAIK